MFPAGLVGAALLVLRISLAAAIIFNGCLAPLSSGWLAAGLMLAACMLIVGALTPYAAVLGLLLQTGVFFTTSGNRFQLLTSIIGSGVVSVLGPGAYSIDSRLFGRKVLKLPSKK
jgi:hypothetical protein